MPDPASGHHRAGRLMAHLEFALKGAGISEQHAPHGELRRARQLADQLRISALYSAGDEDEQAMARRLLTELTCLVRQLRHDLHGAGPAPQGVPDMESHTRQMGEYAALTLAHAQALQPGTLALGLETARRDLRRLEDELASAADASDLYRAQQAVDSARQLCERYAMTHAGQFMEAREWVRLAGQAVVALSRTRGSDSGWFLRSASSAEYTTAGHVQRLIARELSGVFSGLSGYGVS